MSTPSPERETVPTEADLEAMLPTVLELQKLIQERLGRGLRPRDELAIISVTSCNHHSCS